LALACDAAGIHYMLSWERKYETKLDYSGSLQWRVSHDGQTHIAVDDWWEYQRSHPEARDWATVWDPAPIERTELIALAATIIVEDSHRIPATVKNFPKPPVDKRSNGWHPNPLDAEWSAEAYYNARLKRRDEGMVIAHPSGCGLALTQNGTKSDWTDGESVVKPKAGWNVTHVKSGRGLGSKTMAFGRAKRILELALTEHPDWNFELGSMPPEAREASKKIMEAYA